MPDRWHVESPPSPISQNSVEPSTGLPDALLDVTPELVLTVGEYGSPIEILLDFDDSGRDFNVDATPRPISDLRFKFNSFLNLIFGEVEPCSEDQVANIRLDCRFGHSGSSCCQASDDC